MDDFSENTLFVDFSKIYEENAKTVLEELITFRNELNKDKVGVSLLKMRSLKRTRKKLYS